MCNSEREESQAPAYLKTILGLCVNRDDYWSNEQPKVSAFQVNLNPILQEL